jgi:hypothetical protein
MPEIATRLTHSGAEKEAATDQNGFQHDFTLSLG